jgi:antitoxin component YwqK of YwqJK toxin-antitoxin module
MTAPKNNIRNRFTATLTPLIFVWVLLGYPAVKGAASPEVLVENYPNGKVHNKIEVDKQRQPHAWSREYTAAGILKAERHYQHGVRDGISRLYYTTGKLMTEWVYRNGKRHGTSVGYSRNGRVRDKGTYQNDLLEGEVLKYYPNGTVKARMNFKHNRLEGESTIYYETGQVQYIYRYFKGQVWTRKDYSPDGKLISKQEFPLPSLQP